MAKLHLDEALNAADSRNNLQIKVRLSSGADGLGKEDNLSISEEDFKN